MKEIKLSDIITFNPKETIKKGSFVIKIEMTDLVPHTKFIIFNKEKQKYTSGTKFRNNDVLLARITPCLENGKTAKVSGLRDEIAFGSTEFIVMRSKANLSDSDFIYYLAISKEFRKIAIKSMTGTSGRQRVQLDVLENARFKVPKYIDQVKIGNILSLIDKKIELNTHINNNLYEIMKRFFDNWVNNLDNYEESSLSKIANYINGLAMQKYRAKNEIGLPVIKIKEMNEGITDNTERCSSNIKEDYIIKNGDILFAWSGTLCMTIWAQGKAGLNQHIFKVQSKKYPKWFYYLWTEYYLDKFVEIAAGKATTMGHIKRKELDTAKVKIPIKKEMDKMDRIMQPMLDKYINNKINNETLKQVRDTLLPKLMNGEIDLDKIEI